MEFDLTRKYYEEGGYQPFVFYVVFGIDAKRVEISRDKHHVENIPEGIEINYVSKQNDEEYMKGFFAGSLGLVLYDDNPQIYDKANEANNAVIISGNVKNASNFEYMKEVIGIVKAFSENGAVGILDLLNMSFISPSGWDNKYFEKDVDPLAHVTIFVSDDINNPNKCWFHTRGLRKFGRPDLSMHNIDKEDAEEIKKVFDLLIDYAGRGALFKNEVKVKTPENILFKLKTEYIEDFNDSDYNNAHLEIEITDKQKED